MTTSVLAAELTSQNRLFARHAWQVSWLADKAPRQGGPKSVASIVRQRVFLAFPAIHHEKADDS